MGIPPTLLERLRKARADFQIAHQRGMEALAQKDYDALGAAIDSERQLIETQAAILEEIRREGDAK